jgi:hypothetical protein
LRNFAWLEISSDTFGVQQTGNSGRQAAGVGNRRSTGPATDASVSVPDDRGKRLIVPRRPGHGYPVRRHPDAVSSP